MEKEIEDYKKQIESLIEKLQEKEFKIQSLCEKLEGKQFDLDVSAWAYGMSNSNLSDTSNKLSCECRTGEDRS